jgi:hypothetical protein
MDKLGYFLGGALLCGGFLMLRVIIPYEYEREQLEERWANSPCAFELEAHPMTGEPLDR